MNIISLMVLFLFVGDPFMAEMVDTQTKFGSKTEIEVLIEEKLKQLNKPAIKTIQGKDGDIIDCVDIYKQPAFNHPLLKDHKIQMRPSEKLLAKLAEIPSTEKTGAIEITQFWQENDTCPDGTIPILRVQKQHLLQSPSIENYGRKVRHNDTFDFGGTNPVESDHLHEQAILVGTGYSYVGATAQISVWSPKVEAFDEYSSGQIWLRNGPYSDTDSVEVGWIVYPYLYGDYVPRFFVYWTADSGSKTGCFNTFCPGFVQTSTKVLVGGKLSQVSTRNGPKFYIAPKIVLDEQNTDKWWVMLGDEAVGYWPTSIFKSLGKNAVLAMFGGDVYSPRMKNQPPHTTTQMGSGEFASMHWGSAAFFSQPRILGYSGAWDYPDPGQTFSFHTNCYSAENHAEKRWGEPNFYFGGPGRSMNCP